MRFRAGKRNKSKFQNSKLSFWVICILDIRACFEFSASDLEFSPYTWHAKQSLVTLLLAWQSIHHFIVIVTQGPAGGFSLCPISP